MSYTVPPIATQHDLTELWAASFERLMMGPLGPLDEDERQAVGEQDGVERFGFLTMVKRSWCN